MDRQRGFTLVELLVVTVAGAAVMAASAGMYAFVILRLGADSAGASVQLQASSLMNEFQRVVQEASIVDTQTVGGAVCLRCAIPAGGADKNMDGVADTAIPSSVGSAGTNAYTAGQWVWFYWGDGSGNPSSAGTYFWRALVSDASTNPSSANADSRWSLVNGNQRFSLLESEGFSVNAAAKTVTVTATFSSLNRADRLGSSESNENLVNRFSVTRTFFWGDPR